MLKLTAVALAYIAVALPATAQARWVQHQGPVLTATLPWEQHTVQEPTVFYWHGLYRMWYTGGFYHCSLGYATSPDGLHWRKRLRPLAKDACHNGVAQNGHGFDIFAVDHADVLHSYTSRDGIHLHERGVPMRPRGWEGRSYANTFEWHNKHGWHLIYDTLASDGIWKMAVATGTRGHWQNASRPASTLGLPGGGMYGGPWLDGSCLYFQATDQPNTNLPTSIYKRCGLGDGRWTPAKLVIDRTQRWEVDQVADPTIARAPGCPVLMFFDGMNNTPGHEAGAIGVARRTRGREPTTCGSVPSPNLTRL